VNPEKDGLFVKEGYPHHRLQAISRLWNIMVSERGAVTVSTS